MICLKTISKQCRLILLTFLLLLPISVVHGATEFMPVDEIKPGMQGIAKTVVSGTKLEQFGVEVLGVMKNKGASGDLILVRTYGDVIDRTGGIAQGMSGSPVYINNKLVGAVAFGWSLTDHKIGMVTPIGDMLKLWDMPDHYNLKMENAEAIPDFEQMSTPVMVAGFSEHALTMLQDKLKPFNLVPYGVGDAPEGTAFAPLEPGSAVGVELVRGDVSVGALGTVTYTDKDKVVAFGHPFLRKGNVGYFMTNAYIFTTVSGLENSFKVGTTGDAIGMVNQDRGTGIAGKLDRYPAVVPISIVAKDNDTGKTLDSSIQVVQDEQLFPTLSATSVFNVIDKAMDRLGPGTGKISFEITARNMPGETIKRENMFYSPANIGEAMIGEFFDAMNILAGNQYNPVDIMDVKVNVAINEERHTATLIEAQAKQLTGRPGEKIEIGVKLKPFRGEPITRVIPFVIPNDQPEGQMTLEVRGGGMVPLLQLLVKQAGLDESASLVSKTKEKNKNFEDVINDFNKRDHNNDIVVEVLDLDVNTDVDTGDALAGKGKKNNSGGKKQQESVSTNDGFTLKDEAKKLEMKGKTSIDLKKQEEKKNSIATDYIIDGDTQITVNVEKKHSK